MLLGYCMVIALTLYDRIQPRKIQVLLMLFVLSIPVVVKVGPAMVDRFMNAPEASGESRHLANDAAIAMANSHLFGVGVNNYSHAINETKFVRFIDDPVDRGIVHNIYLLHACEMGWLGLIVFVIMIGRIYWQGIQFIRRRRNTTASTLAIGIVAAMTTLWFQSFLEWLFRQTYITVEFFMLAGFLVALSRVDRETLKNRKKDKIKKMVWWYRSLLARDQANQRVVSS